MIRRLLVVLPLLALAPVHAMAATTAPAAGEMRGPPVAALASALGLTEAQVDACFAAMAPSAGQPGPQADRPAPTDGAAPMPPPTDGTAPPADAGGAPIAGGPDAPPDHTALLACLQQADPTIDADALDKAMPAPPARN